MAPTLSIALTLLAATATAAPPPKTSVGPSPWDNLVQPAARWTLLDDMRSSKDRLPLIGETKEVRLVGAARVARIRWTLGAAGGEEASGAFEPLPAQIAVTKRGVYFLAAELDDAEVAAALAKRPTYANPPKLRKSGRGDYVEVRQFERGPAVCVGTGPTEADGPCGDVCYGELCVSPTDGFVRVEANWAPGQGSYAQSGYSREVVNARCAASADCAGGKVCFEHRCVAADHVACPAETTVCPPHYSHIYADLEKLCQGTFTDRGPLDAARERGEVTAADLDVLAAFGKMLRGDALDNATVRAFYTDVDSDGWLPHPCVVHRGRQTGTDTPADAWENELKLMAERALKP